MAGGKNSQKDKAMASYLEKHNIQRTSGPCIHCRAMVPNGKILDHFSQCQGSRRKGSY